jgi:hypothetical protein
MPNTDEEVVCMLVKLDKYTSVELDRIEVTAIVPTLKVVERLTGAGSSNISFVGEEQSTVTLSVPQQGQVCDTLL